VLSLAGRLRLPQNHQRRSQEFELLRRFVAAYGVAAQDVTTRRGNPHNENIVGAYPFTRVFRVRPDDARSFTRILVQLCQVKSRAKLPAYDNALLLLEIDCPADVDYRLLIQSAKFFP
jgi:hypothetical protein